MYVYQYRRYRINNAHIKTIGIGISILETTPSQYSISHAYRYI